MNFAVPQTRAKLASRQDERRRASDARMLRAAMKIIAQKGAAGASLAEIGVAAGFSRGLPAERFGTKLAMLNALMDFMEGWFAERLRKAVGDKTGLDAVRARIDAHIDSACASPVATAALYSIFVESLCAIPELQPRTRALSASFHDGFGGHLGQAKRRGELRRFTLLSIPACANGPRARRSALSPRGERRPDGASAPGQERPPEGGIMGGANEWRQQGPVCRGQIRAA
jgi:AcrR family transcriptional regulator